MVDVWWIMQRAYRRGDTLWVMDAAIGHIPVLVDEVLALLDPQPGQVFVDATAGLGGHAAAIAPLLGPTGTIVLNDLDPGNLQRAEHHVKQACEPGGPTVRCVRGNFADLPVWLENEGLRADRLLADLGFASSQVDDPSRGLSFSREGPLDMRLDPDGAVTAADLIADLDERDLADLIYEFGEDRASRRIARKIVEARRSSPIATTGQLASIVRAALGGGRGRIDPATRTFQALRIAVNDELGSLVSLLGAIARAARGERDWLAADATIAMIAFHSLEDRPIKRAFVALAEAGVATRVTRKVVRAGSDEQGRNARSRSARLRVLRLGADPGRSSSSVGGSGR